MALKGTGTGSSRGNSGPAVPTIALNPAGGPGSTSVTVTGTGFAENSPVTNSSDRVV